MRGNAIRGDLKRTPIHHKYPRLCHVLLLLGWLGSILGSSAQELVFNEILAGNRTNLRDESGDFSDWIELLNPNPTDLDLSGYGLSDDPTLPFKWVFTNTSIRAHGFLTLFADGKDRQPGLLTSVPPTQIPGLQSWLRASEIATNDTTLIRRSGAQVFLRRWPDLRGTGPAWTQSFASQQPQLLASNATTQTPAAIRFDGFDDALSLPGTLGTNDFCLVVVMRSRVPHEVDAAGGGGASGVSGQRYLFGANHGGAVNAGMGVSAGTNGVSIYEHGDGYMPALAVMSGNLSGFQIVTLQYSNKTPRIYWQGNLAATGTRSSREQVTAPTSLGSGAYGAWSGDLAELLFFNRALSTAEVLGLQQHLSQQYQLPLGRYWHANFSVSVKGETLTLHRPDGSLADRVETPHDVPQDISFGRQPDATGPWRFFVTPTPGSSNLTAGADEFLEAPRFSHAGGFYTNNFPLLLSVTNQGATIRYTLDGAEPTTNSPIFGASLIVSNRTSLPNNLSLIATTPGGSSPPSRPVYKFLVVRAKAFKPGAVASATVTRSFIVDPLGAARFNLPVVSLTSPKANFFDPNIGIYVPGNAPGGNYAQSGDEWERPGFIEFFETNGAPAFAQGTGIRMHGNTSFQFPVKGLRLHPLNAPGTGPFEYQIFPDSPIRSFNRLLLRPSGHDYNLTLFRDVFMQSLGEELGLDIQAHRPAVVFLNGEYWGIHHCQEAFEKGYFASHHPGVDPEQVDYLEGYASAIEGDALKWNEMISFISSNSLQTDTNFTRVQTYMDTANYLDYKICEIYYYRWDIGNHRLWRPRTTDGRFRWILFDCDVGWGGFWAVPPAWAFKMLDYDLEANGPWTQYQSSPGGNDHNGPTITFLLRSLMTNPGFKRDFINRFSDVLNTTFQSNYVIRRIDTMAAELAPEMRAHVDRWHAPGSMTEWSNNVAYLRTYAIQRPGFMRQQLGSRFGLSGSVNVRVQVTDTNAGSIQFSSLSLAAPTNAPWTGIYFRNHPIPVRAVPRPGYRFAAWQGITNTTDRLTLTLAQDLDLLARFEIDPDYVGSQPPAFKLAQGDYRFTHWSAGEPAGSYPSNMWLLTSSTPDPSVADSFDLPWMLSYDRTNRSRIVGLGEEGLGFVNTSDPQPDGKGYAGAVVLALDTRGLDQAEVQFRGRTVAPNSRSYMLSLQSRVGDQGPFRDVLDRRGEAVNYLRHDQTGHTEVIGPIRLPSSLLNQPYVQLRWVYGLVSGTAGPRAYLGLDDIRVARRIDSTPGRFGEVSLTSSGGLQFQVLGASSASYQLQSSADLVNWIQLERIVTSAEGQAQRTIPLAPGSPHLFFRLLAE